ncbi:hypothetical protein K469DRAFT_549869 [Zopfia rhizophila CBS 207.26]|uniref:Uncharacterized protein n=1 Tax=Zopfia rhizophila CBS 207.26 TaxID=1314779 RepID=A0A6A6EST6_9PEZI|nr:hypothetical protein K469DRAFT_549869 [Zopfia rhizophila CBS 207.26]
MLYSVLPTVVQNRIPTLPSIRRSISGLRLRSKSVSTSTEITAPVSPPPSYKSRPGSIAPSRNSISSTSTATEEIEFREDVSERLATSGSTTPAFPLTESESGINWKYANQGFSLLTQAYQESNSLARDADDASPKLARQLYLHGITYLLRGLPSELTQEETLSIQAAIHASILDLQNDPNLHALIPLPHQPVPANNVPPEEPSFLHRITASVVFQTFVVVQFLMPYIKLLIGQAYQFEREHKVTQRMISNTITTVDELGRKSLQLSQTVCRMNDGKVGQAISDLTFWWVQGLTGGIQQGMSEGFVMMGVGRNQTSTGKVEKID